MKIGVAGSIGRDLIMTFPGEFSDSFVEGSLNKVSLSFLVDTRDIRRGGIGGNITFGMGVLGLSPILIASVGHDWTDYGAWLKRHGVNTDHVRISQLYTASYMVTTDRSLNQMASFFPGAMSEAREIELGPIVEKVGGLDLLMISPDDPAAMLRHSETARALGIPIAADPSQQLARLEILRISSPAQSISSSTSMNSPSHFRRPDGQMKNSSIKSRSVSLPWVKMVFASKNMARRRFMFLVRLSEAKLIRLELVMPLDQDSSQAYRGALAINVAARLDQ